MIKRLCFLAGLLFLRLGYGIALWTLLGGSTILLFFTYIVLPLFFHYTPPLQRMLVFLTFIQRSKGEILSNPDLVDLPATRNFRIKTEEGVEVGAWHVLPASLIESAPKERDSKGYVDFFEESLSDKKPVILYMHGNTGSRAKEHRVKIYRIFREMEFHVLTFDYRGYADSSFVPSTETGLVHDAKQVYRYIKERVRDSPIIVWGHSLGTGVSTHAVSELCLSGDKPTALVLESPFNNIRDEVRFHALTSIYRKMPKFEWLFLDPLAKSGVEFNSDRHIQFVDIPILIMHAKDDLVVPYLLGERLYAAAINSRPSNFPPVTFITFDDEHNYGHTKIYEAPDLPDIIKNFVQQAIRG